MLIDFWYRQNLDLKFDNKKLNFFFFLREDFTIWDNYNSLFVISMLYISISLWDCICGIISSYKFFF